MSMKHLNSQLFLILTLLFLFAPVHDVSAQEVVFSDEILLANPTEHPYSAFAFDIDSDGDLDLVSASYADNKIAWYENLDGLGNFSTQKIISTEAGGAISVFCCDLDGDSDGDVISAAFNDDEIAWYENIDGLGTFGPEQVITTEAEYAKQVFSADLDGDGDYDVLSASSSDNKIAWYENTDGMGSFGPQQIISAEVNNAKSVFSVDIDGDGDFDVLSASYGNIIAWYENTDGLGTFSLPHDIATDANAVTSVSSIDLDGDGDNDVLASDFQANEISWYENTDGSGDFGPEHVISSEVGGAQYVSCADLDGDGDNDVLAASGNDNTFSWFENTDGTGNFGPMQIISSDWSNSIAIYSQDIDGDDDLDVITVSRDDNTIGWNENTDGAGNFSPPNIITYEVAGAKSIFCSDLDGDGDNDVLSVSNSDNYIAWNNNTDGNGTFRQQQQISILTEGAESVFSIDIDGDGDDDILSASSADDKIAWYENTDGTGYFGLQQVITTEADSAISVFSADLDGDGDNDVLSASINDNKIAWYENTDGLGGFGPQQVVSTDVDYPRAVFSADIDGDGDLDVI